MISDLWDCDIVGDDAAVIKKFLVDHSSISGDFLTISGNLTMHIWGLSTQLLAAIGNLGDKHWYDFGHAIGKIVYSLIN